MEDILAVILGRMISDEPVSSGEGIIHHAEGVDLLPANIELSGLDGGRAGEYHEPRNNSVGLSEQRSGSVRRDTAGLLPVPRYADYCFSSALTISHKILHKRK